MTLTVGRIGMLLCALTGIICAQTESRQRLEPGAPVEKTLAKDQSDSYDIGLAAGQYVRMQVSPSTKDLHARLRGPDGKTLALGEDAEGDDAQFTLDFVTTTAALYRLEITNGSPAAWRYRVSIAELRAAQTNDSQRVDAGKLELEGRKLLATSHRDRAREALPKLQRALELWSSARDRAGQAQSLCDLGDANRGLNEYTKSIEFYRQALELKDAVGNARWEASVLRKIGDSYSNLGRLPSAADYFARALELQRKDNDIRGQAITLNALAFVRYAQGDLQTAVDRLAEALPLRRQAADSRGEAYTLHSIGTIYLTKAEERKALEYFAQALPMWRAAGERKGEVTTLNNIASVYSQLGDQQTAFDYLHQALPIWRELGDRRGEAQTLNNIAHVHSVLGDYESAIDFEKQALALARAGHDRLAEGNILNNSGAALRRLGKSQAALELYEQALQMETEAGDRRLQGVTLSSIASAYQELGNPRKALDYYDRALALHRAATDRLWEGVTLTGMGAMYFSLGEQEKAFDHVTQAQAAFQAIGARSHEPRALYWMARIEAARGNLEGALERSAAAVDIVESLRSGVGRLDLQTSFFATAREQYELQIDILMRMHRSAQAVETFERARARGLLDLLGELNAGIRQGVAPALLDQERSLRELIDAKTGRQFKLLSGKHTEQQAVAAESETRSILAQYQELESRIRAESPRYAALTHPQPLSLAEIQKEALDGDTVLLEYALGGERSYLWAVTRDRIEAFTLPKRAEIESAAIGVYKEWSSNAPSGDLRQVASLSRMLLGPVRNLLAGKRLLIVDEGALQYVPFGALVGSAGRRMVMDHEIVNLPSASTLVALRRELSGRKQPPKMLAVLADPVYNPSDPRVKTAAPATRAGSPTGFERLRSTRHEAEDIFALWPAQSSLKALDFDASQTLATSGVLADYRVVHFASHGVLNTAHPELSGLVLSTVNEKGVPQEGFLRAHDVFNLKLSADLVVLSACQTALGTDIKGEGLVGLTRGFFYAGAARVMASLWMAPDGGSAELMKIFYQRMRTQHLQPAAALRSAQIAMLEDVRWREPYYWAAFTIQGLYP